MKSNLKEEISPVFQVTNVARLGIGLVPEGRRCFGRLTVNENLIAAARLGYWQIKTVAELFQD